MSNAVWAPAQGHLPLVMCKLNSPILLLVLITAVPLISMTRWRTSWSIPWPLLHIGHGRFCTHERFQVPMGRQGLGRSTWSKSREGLLKLLELDSTGPSGYPDRCCHLSWYLGGRFWLWSWPLVAWMGSRLGSGLQGRRHHPGMGCHQDPWLLLASETNRLPLVLQSMMKAGHGPNLWVPCWCVSKPWLNLCVYEVRVVINVDELMSKVGTSSRVINETLR